MRKAGNAKLLAEKSGATVQRVNLLIHIRGVEIDADFLPAWAK
jgi:hypothetical protein